ncbi:hypothetical protein THOG05_190040 [Vibrio rotiferianus]|uniref:DVUA0089 family protein n=1 Tax=Vibrio rotiferianus TaxID=190895 RepID=UPI00289384D8|nr:hypothetical protein THOG05_190040 [Vibrio rotiferianus]
MKRIGRFLVGFSGLMILVLSINVKSAMIYTGQLNEYTSPTDSGFSDVDYWDFSTIGGSVIFDVYEWDYRGNAMDSMIWLFNDDGALDTSDLLTQNDDYFGPQTDGTTAPLDSYLDVSLLAGDYTLAVGRCCDFSASDIVDGYQYESQNPPIGETIRQVYDYQLTISGNVSDFRLRGSVPEPSALWLFVICVLALSVRYIDLQSLRVSARC